LRENLAVKEDNASNYIYDNTTSQECNDLIEQIESNTFTNLLWSMVKPYIRGKILYTPDTPATRRLVSIVNQTFVPIDNFRLLTQRYVETYSKRLRTFLFNADNQELLKDWIVGGNETSSLFDTFLQSPLGKLENMEKFPSHCKSIISNFVC